MSKEAVGAYVRALREARNLSRVDVAVEVETNESQILRLENGTVDTRSSLLLAVIRCVGGRMDDLAQLMLDPFLTAIHGQRLAAQVIDTPAPAATPPQETDIATIVHALQHDRRLDLWIGYGYRLIEERRQLRRKPVGLRFRRLTTEPMSPAAADPSDKHQP